MRPHPQIPPFIRRPTRTTAELVVPMAPALGDLVPSLVIPLDARAGTRILVDLMQVWREGWAESRAENHGVTEQKSHVRPYDPL